MRIMFIDKVHPLIREELEAAGCTCDLLHSASREELLGMGAGYDGLVIRSRVRIDREFIDRAVKLKFIARVGAGMENIDTEYAAHRGIACLNSPEGNRDAVGEHALGMLLSLLNHMNRADREVRAGKWLREENRGTEIKGKTVAIIGYGNMGSAFAQRLKGFEADVISYDKYKTGYSDGNTREVGLEEVFEQCDILSLHVPLTEETTWMVDERFLATFRKNIWLINTARGMVVRTAGLAEGLRSGRILGAALDVLEYEDTSFESLAGEFPPDLDWLAASDRVILTPHIAGWTHESNTRLASVLADKITRLIRQG